MNSRFHTPEILTSKRWRIIIIIIIIIICHHHPSSQVWACGSHAFGELGVGAALAVTGASGGNSSFTSLPMQARAF